MCTLWDAKCLQICCVPTELNKLLFDIYVKTLAAVSWGFGRPSLV